MSIDSVDSTVRPNPVPKPGERRRKRQRTRSKVRETRRPDTPRRGEGKIDELA